MPSNAVAATIAHATRSQAKGHPQHGQVATPAVWATQAGYPGNKASSVRQQLARNAGNGCGRTQRYGALTAAQLLTALGQGQQYTQAQQAGNAAKAAAIAKANAGLLAKAKARKAQAKQATRKAQATPAAPAPAQPAAQPAPTPVQAS